MRRHNFARWFAFVGLVVFVVLGCRTTDLIAFANPTPTATVTATRTIVRPTFTSVPPTQPPTQVPPTPLPAAPILPQLASPTRAPTLRPAVPTKAPVPIRTSTPVPPPPTPDPYAGWYYKPVNKGCVESGNTRIQGTVYENGIPKNGVTVRLSDTQSGGPLIDDFVTGTDPNDYKHTCPECQGQYRLGIAEGQRIDGNWWVYVLDNAGNPLSPGVYVKTHDNPGCNTATVDFRH